MEFIYLFVFRVLSGAQNGAGYAKNMTQLIISTALLMILALGPIMLGIAIELGSFWFRLFAGVACFASMFGVFGVVDGFIERYAVLPKDIHLWEMLATGGVVTAVFLLGGNWFYIVAHLYPSLILHKAIINQGLGQPFWYYGTDDATGKTFAIPLLGIKVPRLSLRHRQILAVVSILLAIATRIWNWDLNIYVLF